MDAARTARYWAKVDRRGIDECWEWTAFRNQWGYGMFAGGTEQLAHRYGYRLEHGAIPAGLSICHHCDNPPCQNPRHLYAGTAAQNAADKMLRGRHVTTSRPGESNPRAKLTAKDAAEIRTLAADGRTQASLAEQFGISQTQVSRIVNRRRWA